MSIKQHSGQSNHYVATAWQEYDGGMPNSFQSHHDVSNCHGLISIPASLYLIPNTLINHLLTYLLTLAVPEDIVINSMFHPGPSMHLSTASVLQLSEYGTVCLLIGSRPSSLDWRTSHWHSSPLRNIQFLLQFLSHNLHLFLSVWIQLIQLFPALMHSNYVQQYSTVRFWAVSEDR